MKNIINKIPFFGERIIKIKRKLFPGKPSPFHGTEKYWNDRYQDGGNSGSGSYNRLAEFKGEIINKFVIENNIQNVIELGCGDGNQLKYFNFKRYWGYDISKKSIEICRDIFKNDNTKSFALIDETVGRTAELVLSLDVIFHLVEDTLFENYMQKLFDSSEAFVIIYSSNKDYYDENIPHFRQREFTRWIKLYRPDFELIKYIPNKFPFNGDEKNSSVSDFFIYKRNKVI